MADLCFILSLNPQSLWIYEIQSKCHEFLNVITEIRTCCGFRENMIQVANKPFDVSRLE